MSASTSTPMPVHLLDWRPLERNSLRGFAKIRLGKSLVMSDVAVHCSNGKKWAQLPSKPQLDRDGNPKRSPAGKILYVPILEWSDRGTADAFSAGVIAAIERDHPGATESSYAA